MEVLKANSTTNEQGCLLWQGQRLPSGYGLISYRGRQRYVHRLSFFHATKQEPEVVRHTCDNPSCWNKEHLKGGLHCDNVEDKVARNRQLKGRQIHNAVADEDMVRAIRASGLPLMQLVKLYPLSKGAIHSILTGRTWKHVAQTRAAETRIDIEADAVVWPQAETEDAA